MKISTENPQHFSSDLGYYGVAFPVERKEIQFGGDRFVMIQTARIFQGILGSFQRPYRIELYRVDPADGLETFVTFIDDNGSRADGALSWLV